MLTVRSVWKARTYDNDVRDSFVSGFVLFKIVGLQKNLLCQCVVCVDNIVGWREGGLDAIHFNAEV